MELCSDYSSSRIRLATAIYTKNEWMYSPLLLMQQLVSHLPEPVQIFG